MNTTQFSGTAVLETERLWLRHWQESDAAALYRLASDPAVGTPAGWLPHRSEAESRTVIRTVFSGPEVYAVCRKPDGQPIGSVDLVLDARSPQECELGFWLGRAYWGQGLIPEAARALLQRAFSELQMEKVWCAHYSTNEKSRRAQEKLGFVYHHTVEKEAVPSMPGVRLDHVMNCMTKEQWALVR